MSGGKKEDLKSEDLDRLVDQLKDGRLIIIDEISTVGAVQFAVICRRLHQVSNVLWRRNFARSLPEASRSIVGIFGLLVVGDFGQLPLVMASL